MEERIKQHWDKFKIIMKDKSGGSDFKTVANILFTPYGYKFLKNNIEKYAVQLGMLNQLLKKKLITNKEHSTINQDLKRKYDIK